MTTEPLTAEKAVFRQGAKIRQQRYTLQPVHSFAERETLPEEKSMRGEAYRMAIANRHKPWARRYLRERKASFT